jgi:hypothetical protein
MSINKKFLVPTAVLISGLLGATSGQASTETPASGSATNYSAAVNIASQLPVNTDLSELLLTKNSKSGHIYAGHSSHSSHASHRSHYSSR